MALVDEQFGAERASAMRSEADKLALSMLTGSGGNDTTATAFEETLVKLLGGSRPHPTAEIDDEGGSVSAGTLGSVTGPEGQWSVRSAYPRWARGVARSMGPVVIAAWKVDGLDGGSRHVEDILGEEGDFGVAAALNRVPHNLPVESVRSICRYLLSELSRAVYRHRREPGAPLPNIQEIVGTMAKEVFSKRMLDFKFAEKVAKENAALTERLAKIESRLSSSSQKGGETSSSGRGASNGEKSSSKYSKKRDREDKPSGASQSGESAQELKRTGGSASSDRTKPTTSSAGQTSGSSGGSQPAGKQSSTGGATIETMMGAVKALQVAVRTRLSLPTYHNNGEKEPCAWLALAGKCKNHSSCKSCKSKVEMPSDLVEEVKGKCKPGVFSSPDNRSESSNS